MEGWIATVLKLAAAVVIGLPLIAYLAQDALIFYRQPLSEARRAEVARRFPLAQEVFIQTMDGTKLHAWHVKAAGAGAEQAPLLLYFGGNAEEVSWMLEETGQTLDVAWLLVSYRGYGLSEGTPGEKVLVSDALQWFDRAQTLPGVDPQRVFAFGRSLGSGVAVALAAQRPIAGLILTTPYDSLAALAKRYYWYLPVDLLLKHRFDSIARAPALKQPLLCLIAERDEVVPPVHAERLFAAWGGPKRKVILPEAGHNTTDAHPAYWLSIREFLAQQVK
ncbi:MAG: alpha/beta hydrolase [Betaproteobacteria bacterium]|nr:alpha/beta hydrolase [Betaproteobacteria bacterium]